MIYSENDSVVMQGRYHYLRLYPLSFAELDMDSQDDLLELLELGGFPEPFFAASQVEATGKKDYLTPDGIRVQPAHDFLRTLI